MYKYNVDGIMNVRKTIGEMGILYFVWKVYNKSICGYSWVNMMFIIIGQISPLG